MSFNSSIQADNFATPKPCDLGRSVRDFYNERDAVATPRRFSTVATPLARKANFAPDMVAGTEEDEHKEHLEELLHQSWTVHSVSPLFGFQHDHDHFSALEKRLKEVLPSTSAYHEHQVCVETVMGIRGSREDDQAVRISVKCLTNGHEVSIFMSYLISVDSADLDLESRHVNLPLCLSAGDINIGNIIFSNLERIYDSIIRPVDLTQDDLQWMTALWASLKLPAPDDSDEAEKKKLKNKNFDVIKFRFKLPSTFKHGGLNTIDVQLDGQPVREIWKSIHSNQNPVELTSDEKDLFHESLGSFIKSKTDMDIRPLSISNVSLPILSAADVGRVRINDVTSLKSILSFLTTKCQGDMLSAKPRMALVEDVQHWETCSTIQDLEAQCLTDVTHH